MAFAGFHLPNIQNADLSSDKDRRKILEYLYQLTEQLRFVLSNIDEDNLNPKFREEIENNETVNALSTRVENAETGVYSLRKQTAEGFSQMVRKDGVVSAINQTAELIQIAAAKIALEGYVSINGAFSVDEGGFMRATGGTIGGWNIVPNMLLGGPTSEINSGKIVGSLLYATEIRGSSGIYTGWSGSTYNPDAPYLTTNGVFSSSFSAPYHVDSVYLSAGTSSLRVGTGDVGASPFSMNGSLSVTGSVYAQNITALEQRVAALEAKGG